MFGGWLRNVINEALRRRNSKVDDEEKGEYVLLSDQLYKDLQETNYLSSKFTWVINIYRETWQRCVLASEENPQKESVLAKEAARAPHPTRGYDCAAYS